MPSLGAGPRTTGGARGGGDPGRVDTGGSRSNNARRARYNGDHNQALDV